MSEDKIKITFGDVVMLLLWPVGMVVCAWFIAWTAGWLPLLEALWTALRSA